MSTATSMLRGRSLARRMTSVLAATLLIALAGSGFGAWSLGQVAKRTDEIVGQSLATERLIVDWHRNVAIGIRRTTAMAVSADPSLADYFAAEAAASTKATAGMMEQIAALLTSEEEKRLFAESAEVRKAFVAAREKPWRATRT